MQLDTDYFFTKISTDLDPGLRLPWIGLFCSRLCLESFCILLQLLAEAVNFRKEIGKNQSVSHCRRMLQ